MELSQAPALLAVLPLKGRLLTIDALYCQRELCARIREAGGDYLVIVKKNQKCLYEDIELLFGMPPPGERFAKAEQHGGHGDRREARTLWASTALRGYVGLAGAEQVCKVERVTKRKGKVSGEVRYAITSMGERTSAQQLLEHIRGHWRIENRLHHVRDVTFGEDAAR